MWCGVGYAVAQDRLFQLELFRRATSGRLAEILGPSYLEMDIEARRDYFTDAEIEAQLGKLPANLRARFDAYRDGINAWVADVRLDPAELPGEFPALGVPPTDSRRRHRPDRSLPRAHRPVRRRQRARERARAGGDRPECIRPPQPGPQRGPAAGAVPREGGQVPLTARAHARRGARGVRAHQEFQ